MMKEQMKALLSIFLVMMVLLTACGNTESVDTNDTKIKTDSAVDTEDVITDKPYDGTSIRIIFGNHNWTDVILEKLPEFTEKTGIKVEYESYPEDQLSQKIAIELASKSEGLDGYMIRPLQEGKQHILNGWVADVSSLVNDSEYNKDDIIPSMQDIFKMSDNGYYGVPLVGEREVLYYRKDLLKEKNIEVPTTMEELRAAAEALDDKEAGISGFIARGQQSQLVTQLSSYIYAFGGEFMDYSTNTAKIDTPEAVEAMEFYGELLRDFGPEGVLNMTWQQASAVFSQGKAALYTDADSLYRSVIGENDSPIKDQVGFAVMPAGPAGHKTYNVCSWGLAVSSFSKNKEATMEFYKWATSPEMVNYVMSNGIPMARKSSWENTDVTAGFPSELVDVIIESNEFGVAADRPLVIQVGKTREAIGTCVQTVIGGEDINTVLESSTEKFQDIINEDFGQ